MNMYIADLANRSVTGNAECGFWSNLSLLLSQWVGRLVNQKMGQSIMGIVTGRLAGQSNISVFFGRSPVSHLLVGLY